jgi:hypothetical protein
MVTLTAGDIVELQGYFRVADGYFAAEQTSVWGLVVASSIRSLGVATAPHRQR